MERQLPVFQLMPGDLLLFLTSGIKKTAVWNTKFVSEHLDTAHSVQSQQTKCSALVACFGCQSHQSW